jgi:hypothetical protein
VCVRHSHSSVGEMGKVWQRGGLVFAEVGSDTKISLRWMSN